MRLVPQRHAATEIVAPAHPLPGPLEGGELLGAQLTLGGYRHQPGDRLDPARNLPLVDQSWTANLSGLTSFLRPTRTVPLGTGLPMSVSAPGLKP